MSTPQTGAPEWDSQQASPWLPANKARRTFDAFCLRTTVIDRDLTAPPATCSDGARYFVATGATGDWAGKDGQLAIAFGTNASNGWVFALLATEGVQIWIEDEETQIEYVNGAWILSPDQVRYLGDLADVDLTGLNDGDQIYWDASNGQWFPAPPSAGSQPAGGTTGQVLTKQSATDGDVYWNTLTVNELADVDITAGLNDGDQLLWDSSNAAWYPAPPATDGGGSPWSLISTWTYSSDVTEVDFANLGDYTDLQIIVRNITFSVSGVAATRLSIDNGASFYSTSGDYLNVASTGTTTNTTWGAIYTTDATAARTSYQTLPGVNISGNPKLMLSVGGFTRMFVASTSPVNAIRIVPSNGGNITGGTIYLMGR